MKFSHSATGKAPLAEQCMHRFAEHMSHKHEGEDLLNVHAFEVEGDPSA
jgi:hypothetical protein